MAFWQKSSNPVPPSTSASDHEMHDYYTAQDASQYQQPETSVTPYLGLKARLSQTWINRWTILLLLVLVRTLLAIASLDDNLASARKEAFSACTSVENVGSALASLPHYMADGVNDLTAKGVEKAINGLIEMLILTVTGVEEIILFMINVLTSTYLCLITLAITGSLHVALQVAKDVGAALNTTVQDIGKDLGGVANTFQNSLNSIISDADSIIEPLSGKTINAPKLDLSGDITKLDSLQLPSNYYQGLDKLNNSIPTFDQVQNFTNNAIRLPFEEVKKLLNASLPKYAMNTSLFPVPAKKQLTFCSDNDPINHFFDELVGIEKTAQKVFLVVIIIAAILAMIPMAYREYRGWMFMKNRSKLIMANTKDPMDAVYLASRPYTSLAGIWAAKRFKSQRKKNLVRWTVAYATTVPALFVLSLAVAGLLGCLCQWILLKAIEKEVPALSAEVGAFADKVVAELNNASESWAIGADHAINETSKVINGDILGWVNTTSIAVNNTLNVFVDEMVGTLNKTFGGTVLYDPVLDVLNCLVFLKIKGIEKGLTWVSDHAHVNFPQLDPTTFSLGAAAKVSGSENNILAATPGHAASDEIDKIVTHVTDLLEKAVRQETIISACLLIVWVIILVIGFVRALVLLPKDEDDGTYNVYNGPPPHGPVMEKRADIPIINAPTYEQATANGPVGDQGANRFNGQAYTLAPNPMPTFAPQPPPTLELRPTSPLLQTGFAPTTNEKLGTVGSQPVDLAVRRPTHLRQSSHGDVAVTSPVDHNPPNPFLSPAAKSNPFADPMR